MNNDTEQQEPLVKRLQNYVALMAPHQRVRQGGKLLIECLSELSTSRSPDPFKAQLLEWLNGQESKQRQGHTETACAYNDGIERAFQQVIEYVQTQQENNEVRNERREMREVWNDVESPRK